MKRIVFFIAFFLAAISVAYTQGVGINSTGLTGDSSAGLDIDFNNKGILIPRVSLVDIYDNFTINTPANSLLVYNTSTSGFAPDNVVPGFYFWNGMNWEKLLSGDDKKVTESDLTNHQGAIEITESQIIDLGSYLEVESDPRVPGGSQPGEMQYYDGSEWITVAPGKNGQTLTIVNGVPTWASQHSVNEVYNSVTGRTWMDRNLGATQVATSSTDQAAYGYYYQWGRANDGHQLYFSDTTRTLSQTDEPVHSDFIIAANMVGDWYSTGNDNLWQGVNGKNNPCPSGYRIPTITEWEAERQTWTSDNSNGAFASPLKLSLPGYRSYYDASYSNIGSLGYYWASTPDGTSAFNIVIYSGGVVVSPSLRAEGYSVRCIKN
ncbi:MAG: hypothetical protein JXR36_06545 [Bacteroidales bacterium]|nr:hypothetical protein [Bacteroidales bacterium]